MALLSALRKRLGNRGWSTRIQAAGGAAFREVLGTSELVHGFSLAFQGLRFFELSSPDCGTFTAGFRCCARRARSSVWVSSCAAGRQVLEHAWSSQSLIFLSPVSLQSAELVADAYLRLCRRPLPLHFSSPDASFPRGGGGVHWPRIARCLRLGAMPTQHCDGTEDWVQLVEPPLELGPWIHERASHVPP